MKTHAGNMDDTTDLQDEQERREAFFRARHPLYDLYKKAGSPNLEAMLFLDATAYAAVHGGHPQSYADFFWRRTDVN